MFHRRLAWREIFQARRELAFLPGRRLCGLLLRELGERSRRADYAAVSVALKRFERRMARVRDARDSGSEPKPGEMAIWKRVGCDTTAGK